jgi:hypothetical protein
LIVSSSASTSLLAVTEGVAERAQASVSSVPAHLWMWWAGDDDGLGRTVALVGVWRVE